MKYKTVAFPLLGMLLACSACWLVGCEYDGLSSESEPTAISLSELDGVAPAAAPASNPPPASDPTDSTPDSSPAANPAPVPAPDPTPAPQSGTFLWEPRADSVRVVIPASLPHWKFWVFSRRKHATLYGPDRRSMNRAENVEYILQGNGAYWRQQSLNAGDDGTLLIVINTKDLQANGERNAGWRIMRPEQAQSGDGDRLQPGDPSY